jgi:hypothetical protein
LLLISLKGNHTFVMVRQHVARFCFYFFYAKVRGKHTFLCCGAGLCSGFVLFLDAVLGSFFFVVLWYYLVLVPDVYVLVPRGGTLQEYSPDNWQ